MEKAIKTLIRDVEGFPKPAIVFKDITPLLSNAQAFHQAIDRIADRYRHRGVEQVVCVEARGFILGAPLAYTLGAGLIPVRKPGKLPFQTLQTQYALEYGTDTLEVHSDAVNPGMKVLIVDDVLATGGTVAGTINLIRQLKAEIVGTAFLIELEFLKGREKLQGLDVFSLIQY